MIFKFHTLLLSACGLCSTACITVPAFAAPIHIQNQTEITQYSHQSINQVGVGKVEVQQNRQVQHSKIKPNAFVTLPATRLLPLQPAIIYPTMGGRLESTIKYAAPNSNSIPIRRTKIQLRHHIQTGVPR